MHLLLITGGGAALEYLPFKDGEMEPHNSKSTRPKSDDDTKNL